MILLQACEDGTCCCLPQRSTVATIALVGLIASTVEQLMLDTFISPCCKMREHVESFRLILISLFQMANFLLLLASVVENALLVQLYVWYTLGFVVMGLMVSLLEFLDRARAQGAAWSSAVFVPEVAFLFALFRCLPLVDTYRKHLQGITYVVSS